MTKKDEDGHLGIVQARRMTPRVRMEEKGTVGASPWTESMRRER